MKTKQNNDLTDCIGAVYAEDDIEMWWSTGLGMICDKNQIG